MRTFSNLREELRIGAVLRSEPHVLTVEIHGHAVELFRIEVGADEWVALSVMLDERPIDHRGLAAVVECRGGWALRLVLPVAELSPRTFAETIERMACEALSICAARPSTIERAVLGMWAE